MTLNGNTAAWVRMAAAGDCVALQRLLVEHHDRLREVVVHSMTAALRAWCEPEDILQQVYVRVLQSADALEDRGPEAFFGWLARIAASAVVDMQRNALARKRDVRRQQPTGESPSSYDLMAEKLVVDSITPSRVLSRREGEALLLAALAGLPPDYRRVLDLRYLRGHKLSEVGEAMGRSPQAVQMLAARATRRLRAAVRDLSASWAG